MSLSFSFAIAAGLHPRQPDDAASLLAPSARMSSCRRRPRGRAVGGWHRSLRWPRRRIRPSMIGFFCLPKSPRLPARSARACCVRLWRSARERVRLLRVSHTPCRRTHAARVRWMMMARADVGSHWPCARRQRRRWRTESCADHEHGTGALWRGSGETRESPRGP